MAVRCDNGQGNCLNFRTKDGVEDMIDVAYSTFWNDFSHYSFYLPSDQIKGDVKAITDVPLDYSDL